MNGVSPDARRVFARVLLQPAAPLGLTLALALTVAACGGGSSQPGSAGGAGDSKIIQIDGSSTVYPITEAVAEDFRNKQKGIADITVGTSGTGGGFQKFCRGETDISNASRPIRDVEIEACTKAGITFLELPVAYDGLTVVIHPKNTWATSMTVAELKTIWEPSAEGKITRWSQVRKGWPDRELHLFGAGVDSGTFDYFTEVIVGKQDASRGDYTSSEDDNMLVQGVSSDENALGFFGYAYYEENKQKLQAVAVDDGDDKNGKGPIAPSPETVRNGTYHPLSRPVFIYVNLKKLERPAVQQFVDFYVQNAATLVREVGYVPLTDEESQLLTKRAAAKTAGTMFKTPHAESGTSLSTLMKQS